MRQRSICLVVGLVSLSLHLRAVADSSVEGNAYVTAEDKRAASEASLAAELYCKEDFHGELDREKGRKSLEAGVGADNIVLQALTNADSYSEVGNEFVALLTPAWIFQRVVPILMAVLLFLIWGLCCCGACPRDCFKCCCARCDRCWSACISRCRLGEKMHPSAFKLKVCTALTVFLFVACLAICSVVSLRALNIAKDGADNMFCTSAKLLNGTIGGMSGDEQFIGMIPALEEFSAMQKKLDDNSSMMTELDEILDHTTEINSAVHVATHTMTLLRNMLAEPANVRPTAASGEALFHTCKFCESVQPHLNEAIAQLDNGVGVALAKARSEVDRQLTPEKREELKRSLSDATKPMLDVKDSVLNSLSFIIDTNNYDKAQEYMNVEVVAGVFAVLIVGALVLFCSCGTLGCFIFARDRNRESNGDNPYRKRVHRCACITWCCGFGFAILSFLLGGLLVAAVVPLSGACLVLDDMNSEILYDLPGSSLNRTGDAAVMTEDVINQCVNPSSLADAADANLLDIFFQRSNGTKVTMREKIVEEVNEGLISKFELIESKLNSVSSPNLTINPTVVQLRQLLSGTPIASMIVADRDLLLANEDYQALPLDSRGKDGVAVALVTSVDCNDVRLSDDDAYGDLANQTVPGIGTLVRALEALGESVPASTCAKSVICRNVLTPEGQASFSACTAANNVIDLKTQLLELESYRCDIFEHADGTVCDPADMFKVDGIWRDECVSDNGTMVIKHVNCNLATFTEYLQKYDERINSVFQRLDNTVEDVKDEINVKIRKLMEDHITEPIQRLSDGVTCGFVSTHYRALVDGFCYQGVYGLRVIGWCYVACGIFTLIFIGVMYAVWRFSVDNVNLWYASQTNNKNLELESARV